VHRLKNKNINKIKLQYFFLIILLTLVSIFGMILINKTGSYIMFPIFYLSLLLTILFLNHFLNYLNLYEVNIDEKNITFITRNEKDIIEKSEIKKVINYYSLRFGNSIVIETKNNKNIFVYSHIDKKLLKVILDNINIYKNKDK